MKLVIIVIALLVAVVAAATVSGVFKPEKPQQQTIIQQVVQPQKVPETEIYVAKKDIPIGTSITQEDFETKAWPANLMPPGAIVSGTQIESQITSGPIQAGEPIMASKLRNPNDPGFIAGQLPEGMRALTISVNLTDSVAGFVSPGDMVDVLYIFDLNKGALDSGDLKSTSGGTQTDRVSVSEILLSNVKILAVDKRVTAAGLQTEPGQPGGGGEAAGYPTSVTVAVNQRDAQKLRLAEKVGKLSLMLRSLADTNKTDRVRPTAEQDLTRLLPPAYFPALFNSDQSYDYSVVDLYGGGKLGKEKKNSGHEMPEKIQVNIYRGTTLESKEIKNQ